jgi:hypothetical protein
MEKKKTFTEITTMWFDYFSKMKPDQSIEIAVSGKRDPELFIDMCKEFIDRGNMDFEFTNDYKYFRRMTSWPE